MPNPKRQGKRQATQPKWTPDAYAKAVEAIKRHKDVEAAAREIGMPLGVVQSIRIREAQRMRSGILKSEDSSAMEVDRVPGGS